MPKAKLTPIILVIAVCLCLYPGNAAALSAWYFDIEGSNHDTASGYISVNPIDTYNASDGYGWSAATGQAWPTTKGTLGDTTLDNLFEDAKYSSADDTFKAAVESGTYTVKLYFLSPHYRFY